MSEDQPEQLDLRGQIMRFYGGISLGIAKNGVVASMNYMSEFDNWIRKISVPGK